MNSFRSQMFAAVLSVLARREHEVAGQAIKEARAVGDSDDTAPPNGFNEISDEMTSRSVKKPGMKVKNQNWWVFTECLETGPCFNTHQ